MKHYKVFKHPMGKYEAVKNGWSWPGFFFGIFWSLIKGLWLVTLMLLGVGVLMGTVTMPPESALLLQIIVACVMGYKGNEWRENKLRSTGYTEMGTTFAENGPTAVARQISDFEN